MTTFLLFFDKLALIELSRLMCGLEPSLQIKLNAHSYSGMMGIFDIQLCDGVVMECVRGLL
jgi:hypothetical protein